MRKECVALAVAILLLQLRLGVIPASLTVAALESVLWPYLLLIVILTVGAMLEAPVELDNQRTSDLVKSSAELQAVKDDNRRLQELMEAPKISPLEQQRRDFVHDALRDATDPAIAVLKLALTRGAINSAVISTEISPKDRREADAAIVKYRSLGLLVRSPTTSTITSTVVKPELRDALSFHLLG